MTIQNFVLGENYDEDFFVKYELFSGFDSSPGQIIIAEKDNFNFVLLGIINFVDIIFGCSSSRLQGVSKRIRYQYQTKKSSKDMTIKWMTAALLNIRTVNKMIIEHNANLCCKSRHVKDLKSEIKDLHDCLYEKRPY